MTFLADFHIHSRYSRATSKELDLERLYIAAQLKGLAVVGTGDATHPGWFGEIKDKLEPSGDGLLRLKAPLRKACAAEVPDRCRAGVHFILVSEISNIYKKNGKTRKNHNLVFMPTLETAARFNRRLDRIGNIRSDGRPILGLDARDLLEIVLETDERAFLIPAHIWTPWFSLLGSKSGFDSLEECFEDLAPHIFAAETGLSSDPAMNRLVSGLDRLTLVSNSDAHSAAKLGREANLFSGHPGFSAMRRALEDPRRAGFEGTLEFYPEEGKYHLDGHRKCGVSLTPEQTRELQGLCPVCGRPITVGVFNRVQALADRRPDEIPDGFADFESLIPLKEILSEVLEVGPATKTVARAYGLILTSLGSELAILRETPIDRIDAVGVPLLGEAVRRMRAGQVTIEAGYDGEYGRIKIFSDAEKQAFLCQRRLFPGLTIRPAAREATDPPSVGCAGVHDMPSDENILPFPSARDRGGEGSDPDQQNAVTHGEGPLLIVAGPGTGKTRTLTHRIAHLITGQGVSPRTVLAVTFTDKAAREMRDRLIHLLPEGSALPLTATFHALCWTLIREETPGAPLRILDDEERLFMIQRVLHHLAHIGQSVDLKPRALLGRIVEAKQLLRGPETYFESVAPETASSQFARAYRTYQTLLESQNLLDFEDLIFRLAHRLETDAAYRKRCRGRFVHVFVDEYQDVNHAQYRLVRALVPTDGNLCVIGDPDQAIYGFRGSDAAFFNRFVDDYPTARVIHLTRNYRSTETILAASWQVMRQGERQASGLGVLGSRLYSKIIGTPHVAVVELPSEKAEAVAVGQTIEKAVGGAGFLAIDSGKVDGYRPHDYSFADFAVLYRTSAQADIIADVFTQAGIPFQAASRRQTYGTPAVAVLLSLLRLAERLGSAGDLNRIAGFLQPPLEKEALLVFLEDMETRGLSLHEALDRLELNRLGALPPRKRQRLGKALAGLGQRLAALQPLDLKERIFTLAGQGAGIAAEDHSDAIPKEILAHLVALCEQCGGHTERFLASVALAMDADMVQPGVEKVTLATLHAAKGLEFPVVLVVGCEDGLIPLRRKGHRSEPDLEEERRLFYVALTRARDRLYLFWSRKRRVYGRREARTLSPFVGDIERQLLRHQAPQLSAAHRSQQTQLKLF